MAELGLIFGGVLGFLFILTVLVRWNELWFGGKGLPGGTMGWPLFGETIQFLKHGPNFMKNRKLRYGNLFKTHILGCPTVVSMDPDVNRFILMSEGKGVTPGYPQPMQDILGKWSIIFVQGALHKSMRGALLSLISPSAIKEEILPKIDSFMQSYLLGLGGKTVDIQEMTREILVRLAIKLMTGMETEPAADILVKELSKLLCGTLSLPIYLPGSNYRRAFKAREKIVSILRDVVRERRGSSSGEKRGILQSLLQVDQKADHRFTDEQIIDLLISIVFAAMETTPATSMMAFNYLHDHPRALEEAREEHLKIRRRKAAGDKIEWEDYTSMSFTRGVILETLRLATIVNGVLRKTTEDLEINGFTIPGGWKIYVYIRENNYDPFLYPEPLQFNPWRWQDKSLESHQNFMVFGGGRRLCAGKELGIVQMSMFLHVLLTRYRWEEIGGEKISYFPRVEAPNGLHYRVFDL